MTAKKKPLHAAILIIIMILATGCTHILPPPQDDGPARQVLDRLVGNNAGLTHFKALGHIRMDSGGTKQSGRVAVAAVFPNKLRADWLNITGQPLVSVAGNGETIHIWNASDAKMHRLRQSPKALAKLIRIPLGIDEFQSIIIGRPPLPSHSAVQYKESHDDVDILSLKNRWREEVARITVDRSSGKLLALQVFDGHGRLQYETRWLQWRREGKYLLPIKVSMDSDTQDRFILTVDRFWPDAEVPCSVFELNPPQG
jgi:outer membrane biogenesis lipoprotein LolB